MEPEDGTAPAYTTVADADGEEYRLIEGRLPTDVDALSVSKLIDADGGTLTLAGHKLAVPAGAVDGPTLFTMTLPAEGYVEVGLSATVEVGETVDLFEIQDEFHEPVTLSLTYARAEDVDDPDDLVILRMLGDSHDDPHEALSSTLGDGKVVMADLDHFSRYCMASS